MLEIRNLTAGYQLNQPILYNFNLELGPNKKIGITGPNGSGKSTLLSAIMGTAPFIKGEMLWNGESLLKKHAYERNGMGIACFLQGGRVFKNMTVADNLSVALAASGKENPETMLQKMIGITDFPVLNLSKRKKVLAGNLSGGERHVLAFLMVLLNCPNMKLLLADEPSAGLSAKVQQEFLQLLALFFSKRELTSILVEQNIPFLNHLTPEVIVIENKLKS